MPEIPATQAATAAGNAGAEVRRIIENIKSSPHSEPMRRVRGSYLFDVEGAGRWRIGVDHGKLAVEEGRTDADCIVRTDADYFLRIATGRQNLVTAAMQGRVEIEGDMALAQKLSGITPSPRQGGSQPRGNP
ncbi:MAG TPA: SCP2 sterol-binding domain-containing protein [Fibrobacteria bacterium]|nr:SCP2 sterol-binding domain-containing protein [Fibrobacteria bacterium]